MINNLKLKKKYNILIVAGGTGGHIFPAEALAEKFKIHNEYNIHFITDIRGVYFSKKFPANNIKIISGATIFSKSFWILIKSIFKIKFGIVQSFFYIYKNNIDITVSFGGYLSFGPLLVSKILLIPSILHEQNAVLGRANRLLARFSKKIATSFIVTKYTKKIINKVIFIGNPLRSMVSNLKFTDYTPYMGDGKFNLVIFGGSQGAKILSDILPKAIKIMPKIFRKKINIIQQVHKNDIKKVSNTYDKMNVSYMIKSFFFNMPELIANSHLVISRAGATTIAELCYIGRPSLLIPLPNSFDESQINNAKNITNINGGWVCLQNNLNAEYLSKKLIKWIETPNILINAAKNVKILKQLNAVESLVLLVKKYIK